MFKDKAAYEKNVKLAESIMAMNQSEEMMPRSAFWAPITASRFSSLHSFGGKDDYFSSDFTDEQLCQRLSHIGRIGIDTGMAVLVAASECDEYVPPTVDIPLLLQRLCNAMNASPVRMISEKDSCLSDILKSSNHSVVVARPLLLHQANHNLSSGNVEIFIDEVRKLLQSASHLYL